MNARPAALGYRPELDGLRALAVLAVMLFHANADWTKGGFLGVDIFFVLSGFLITRLLLEEREVTGHVGLLRFYLRRVLRLFPALVAVSIAVAVYAGIWLDHSQAVQTWRDVLATATYHMNWVEALTTRPLFGLLDHWRPHASPHGREECRVVGGGRGHSSSRFRVHRACQRM